MVVIGGDQDMPVAAPEEHEKVVTVCGELVRSLDANGKEMVIRREVSVTETRESRDTSLKVEIPSEQEIELPVIVHDKPKLIKQEVSVVEPLELQESVESTELSVTSKESTEQLPSKDSLDSPSGSTSRAGSSVSATASPMHRNTTSQHGGLFVSAPGKIILFGEHAVVYGRTAIAGSIDLRTYVSLYTSADGRIYLSLPDLGVEKTWMLKDLLKAADRLAAEYPIEEDQPPSLEILVPIARKLSGSCEDQCGVQHLAILAFWYLLLGVAHRKRDLLAVKATVRFKLPSCVGLGSSGAYCVCIATSLLQTAGLIPPPSIVADEQGNLTWEEDHLDIIRKWATAAESLIHGRASGLDAAVCTFGSHYRDYGYQSFTHLGYVGCFGGVASFKPGHRIEHLKNLPDLRVILVNSKVERNTARMVQTVKERLKKFPEVVDAMFGSIDAISLDAAKILHRPLLEENGGGDTGSTVQENGLGPFGGNMVEQDHHSLQPTRTASVRSSSLSSYVGGGKRNSSASVISATSEKGENVDTFSKLNDLCRINNQLLIALGVGHPKVDLICTTLARYGIHPKMTGAGGGGSVFAFLKPNTPQTLLDMIDGELRSHGFEVWQPPLGGPGVVEHQTRPELFQTPVSSTQCSTPASKHK
ncbi:GHMP kinase C-terminal domain-containing protein [Caenorhabditis elegans]|uniref:GHMP kinase C-terminal domain-containing protein n=3 Tax=Caenorhabditis elegans TaxID=6239 RepID=A0A8S4QBV1_CAEEL|nr:Mevalonate kinase [Caenorhabditis elegans]CAH2176175.1 Mevalonate kinase [Caenorhabditis elegans]